MKVSVFTPFYKAGNPFILDAYYSLRSQSWQDWEWVILANGEGWELPEDILRDQRVMVHVSSNTGVGALKREACGHCRGDVLFELDHDDVLAQDALLETATAIGLGADFVYSDFAEFISGSWAPNPYANTYRWESYTEDESGHGLIAMRAPTDPVAWRRIEWAPNHLRAWRRSFYEDIGGHDVSLTFADDHDLVLRTYISGGKCDHLPKCLYFYRVHDTQNVKVNNAEIQRLAGEVYHRRIYQLAEAIANRRSLIKLDLCGGIDSPDHYTPIDRVVDKSKRPDAIEADLNGWWPLAESSVGVIRAFDALEHLRDPVHTMNEAYRVLAPGGFLLVMVPSTDGKGAFCDPTHVSFWNDLSFRYYTDRRWRRYLTQLQARFQLARLENVDCGGIPYVRAELIALKPGHHPMGEVNC